MKTPILMLFSAFLTVACTAHQGHPTYVAQPANPVVTSFSTSEKGTIEIQVTDQEPAKQAELAAPDGHVFLAYSIDREQVTSQGDGYAPSVGFGVGVGTSGSHTGVGTGIGFGIPFVIGDDNPPVPASWVRSMARIRVNDLAAYRASWQQWKVRVHFGNGANQRMLEVAAPPPPPT